MIAVVQRVLRASVTVAEPAFKSSIGGGLCVFLGIEKGDLEGEALWMARKLAHLRIFNDSEQKMNLSLIDHGGEIMVISQFTLAGNCSHGNRPSFIDAAHPEVAEPLVQLVCNVLQHDHGLSVQHGVFGAMMNVELTNDGPVTIILKRE